MDFILGYTTHIIVLLFLLASVLLISSPYFEKSEVKEDKNKAAYITVTAIGSILLTFTFVLIFFMIKGTGVMNGFMDRFTNKTIFYD